MLGDEEYNYSVAAFERKPMPTLLLFIASLDQGISSGIPDPPQIKVSEVSSQPVELDFIGFGTQGAGSRPQHRRSTPPDDEVLWACCDPDHTCTERTAADCTDVSGEFHPGIHCVDDPELYTSFRACCAEDGSCTITTEAECAGTYQGDDTVCSPNPCPPPPGAGACCVDPDCSIETAGKI